MLVYVSSAEIVHLEDIPQQQSRDDAIESILNVNMENKSVPTHDTIGKQKQITDGLQVEWSSTYCND